MNAASTRDILFQSRIVITLLSIYAGLAYGDVISKFFSNYDKAIRLGFETGNPTTIRSTLYVESFGNIEEANMEFKVYGYFLQYWNDSRLAGKLNRTLTITGIDIDNIWVPDAYCYNARESNILTPNNEAHGYVSIKPNGEILYSKGVVFLASCVMDLHDFPLDTQMCYLKFGSYGYSTEDIIYEWLPGETEVLVGHHEMAQFEYKGSKLSSAINGYPTAYFSTITVTFSFRRRLGYYLIQVYFPTIFVVMLSWVVFWMENNDIGNRMALGIATILTIMFLLGSLNGNLPKVSYPKALDWYLLVSLSFVFVSLMECLAVFICSMRANSDDGVLKNQTNNIPLPTRTYSVNNSRSDVATPMSDNHKGVPNMESDDDPDIAYSNSKASCHNLVANKTHKKMADMIDKASRVLFPLAFVVYNIFYWTN